MDKIQTDNNKKVYLIGSELKDINQRQDEMVRIHNDNMIDISRNFDEIISQFSNLENCETFLLNRDKKLHAETAIVSLALMLYIKIKAYRAAAHAYRMNLLSSITTMTNKRKRIPISLLNTDDLRDILHDLALELVNQGASR